MAEEVTEEYPSTGGRKTEEIPKEKRATDGQKATSFVAQPETSRVASTSAVEQRVSARVSKNPSTRHESQSIPAPLTQRMASADKKPSTEIHSAQRFSGSSGSKILPPVIEKVSTLSSILKESSRTTLAKVSNESDATVGSKPTSVVKELHTMKTQNNGMEP